MRARLARQNVKLNKIVAAPAAFIVTIEHALPRRKGLENLKAIARWDGEFRL
ncbi:hypothetical protein D3C78_1909680 [compost metagenome]